MEIENVFESASFDPDNALSVGSGIDRLGFQPIAKKLAASLITQSTTQGLVMSIEGKWGSGKSSLAFMLADELRTQPKSAPEIVLFDPWLVGNRDGMLAELMLDIATTVEEISSKEMGPAEKQKEEVTNLARALRSYASKVTHGAIPISQLTEILGVPNASILTKALKLLSRQLAKTATSKPLPEVKKELTTGLEKLDRRIVVIIDDLDRLEPNEAAEVMRLIKAVADFPNVIYVLCYDQNNLAKCLENALSIDDGVSYLEKMVQVKFKVPKPEAFDLRRWFLDECVEFHDLTSNTKLTGEKLGRLEIVCGLEGSFLNTPRAVVRALNLVKLHWPSIANTVDYSDLVWLQLIRLKSEDLYSWVEKYLIECEAMYGGAMIRGREKSVFATTLNQSLKNVEWPHDQFMFNLQTYLPGIRSTEDDDNLFYNLNSKQAFSSFIRDHRLGSPHHSRYYFALSKPAGALDNKELQKIVETAKNGEDVDTLFRTFIHKPRPQGGTMFDVLIDRIKSLDQEKLPIEAVPSILRALGNCTDESQQHQLKGSMGIRWTWRESDTLFKSLFNRLDPKKRKLLIRDIFGSGKSVGWLMAEVIREEIVAQGRYGYSAQHSHSNNFSSEELDSMIDLMVNRLRSSDRDLIINTPEVLTLLDTWIDIGEEKDVLMWVNEQLKSEDTFLKLLSKCRGWMASDQVYYPLRRESLEKYLDFDKALNRLSMIAEDVSKPEGKKALARELLKASELGRSF
jgi:predicted KAP-like P-loop ATPase